MPNGRNKQINWKRSCMIVSFPYKPSWSSMVLRTRDIVDPAHIEKMVDKVLSENPKQLEQYRAGKTKIQGFFAGQWNVSKAAKIYESDVFKLYLYLYITLHVEFQMV
ncbi:hypothetical protein NC653_024748 [Populus alba x Populus x berolinensis]|uniref:Asn/Gln amidotransferase domain-containing protein n=1 Tax=Populus alba x Populus x berolinensis TaxID=444605 RepID=A0AAD6M9Y1_9ROSI|nr:hypothetical protein NC653_024748 [Populus alba x Populus x berolinensis]